MHYRRQTVLASCCAAALLLAAGPVAQAQQSGPPPAPAGPANETLLVTLAIAAVVLVSGLITRALLRLRLVRSYMWMLPALAVVSAALWAAVAAYAPPDLARLRAMARFIFVFCAFLCLLVVVGRAAMPLQVLRTRAAVPPLIRRLAVLVCGLLGFFVLLTWSFPGLSLTPVFLTSGALSIIVGLAVQDLLHNVLAGVLLSTERPFKVGDWVRTGDVEGEVAEIGWRVTKLLTREHDMVEIPNRLIIGERLMNYDEPTHVHVRCLRVGVTYETPPALAVNALLEAASRVPSVLESPAPVVHFIDYADSALLYELRVRIDNYAYAPSIDSELRKEIWYSFKRHGITIPFPQRDVHLYPATEAGGGLRARLVAAAGLPMGFVFELSGPRTGIGRDPANRLCIPNQHVSARHALIERQEGRYVLRDLRSRLGTSVNGVRIQSADLHQGDLIELGPVAFVFEAEQTSLPQQPHRWLHREAPPPSGEPDGPPPAAEETKDLPE